MAISFSRPDPSSPAAVGSAAFPVNRRGFDQGEVRDFLRMVAAELARLQERERFLESEMRTMQTRGMSAPGRLDEETVTTLLGEEAARVLSTARDASTQIRDRAEESATRLVKDAAEDAARIRESAHIEAARIHEDALRDAEQEIEMAKQQGRDMVNEARAYREKVLTELSRRRDAARAQIEQLLHGRDRLLNAFERARLASEDVINGLTEAHDEPEFIIDLTPTTGPVPIVNPEHPSVKPFDHQKEDSGRTAEVVMHEVIEEATHEEALVEEIVEELIESISSIDHEEILDEVVTVPEHPVHGILDSPAVVEAAEPVVDDHSEQEDATQTNVVSLFGRGRRVNEVPEIVDTEVAEVEEVNEIEPLVEPTPTTETVSAVDDIFARLRESSTAVVASETKTEVVKAAPVVKAKVAVAAEPARFEERDEALSPLVGVMSRKLKRVLADEQNEVLQHLKLKKSSLEMDAFLGSVDDHAARYAQAVLEEIMAVAGAGAKSVKAAGGTSRRVTQKAVSGHVAAVIAEGFVHKFRDETRIAIGEAEGDRAILSGLMRDVYRGWKTDLLDQYIDDIACSTYSKGGFLALEPGVHVAWVVDPTSGCCSECEDNSLAGTINKGEEFPTGHEFAPAHPGCRCLVYPIQD
jgi:DivIVA domain-containing protein